MAKCCFVWNKEILVIDDAGSISLSLMVVMPEWYQYIEQEALKDPVSLYNIQPKTYKRHVDDSHLKFNDKRLPGTFLNILKTPFAWDGSELKSIRTGHAFTRDVMDHMVLNPLSAYFRDWFQKRSSTVPIPRSARVNGQDRIQKYPERERG